MGVLIFTLRATLVGHGGLGSVVRRVSSKNWRPVTKFVTKTHDFWKSVFKKNTKESINDWAYRFENLP